MLNSSEIKNENIQDSIVINQVSQILGLSLDYKSLLHQLRTQQELFDLQPEENTERRREINTELNQLKERIEQFKKDVLALAETFNKIEINTERLKQARTFFQNGDIGEARALLNDDNEAIQSEEEFLWAKRDSYKKEIESKLIEKAEERLIQALLNQSDYANPNWFEDTCNYFERSIESYSTKENVFNYAVFLWRHNKVNEAQKYYQKYLNDYITDLSLAETANALNNLGLSRWDSNQYRDGLRECEEALRIYEKLSKADPLIYRREIAGTLNNIAMFHNELNENSKAAKEYKKALVIYRNLSIDNGNHLFDVAMILGNLGCLNTGRKKYTDAQKELEESLRIYKQIKTSIPKEYPFYTATVYHNLGNLFRAKKENKKAVKAYKKALDIRLNSATDNPAVYIPEASCTLSVLASFYLLCVPHRKKSIEYALKTITTLLPIYEEIPFTQPYLQTAVKVLMNWELNDDEIDRLIAENMQENKQS
jgi:tetratricopeptide (TPR) repeat protein